MTHKIFGTKENANYIDREGVYLVPIRDGKVGVIKTSKGYFLLGGGIESDESHEECIKRECLEEIGYTVSVGNKIWYVKWRIVLKQVWTNYWVVQIVIKFLKEYEECINDLYKELPLPIYNKIVATGIKGKLAKLNAYVKK